MRESTIEKHLVAKAKEFGALCYKFVSPSCRGVPDRILIFPNGLVAFVEVKAPGKKPTMLQESVHNRMAANNAHVAWVDSKLAVEAILSHWLRLDRERNHS